MTSISPVYIDILPVKEAKIKDIKPLLHSIGLPPSVTLCDYCKGDDEVDVNVLYKSDKTISKKTPT